MFIKCLEFGIAKSLVNSARRLVFKEVHKKHEPILREKLGFNSIDEYMRATPQEIKAEQSGF